ncbi:DsbE family thiol:disulfide interchange protein [Pseudoxanthomonas broegbernensis]|uniref:DsbE family thiol:disulfide interchange protein n=1 Tax=Pseudoxanthomonas broegbernensis TaxID=83619 RepID=A0A7V8K7T0_9GAMM|nr:DsbE family thiol:disulfide interchange protein [Pseudoxanthomonas broegbernensis]KAF1687572.1 DsbE family thiol:disulfide interchange protein [Pseudoxanthomonas broegbernensis]MBB6064587.1 cytochrome c biogenesis protein CcmG/thiol:disulfide interchange protein DsbE [Pseudoxanthomonas broegbernensis]
MNDTRNDAPRKPQGLPAIAVAMGALFFVGLLALMLHGVLRSGDSDRDVLPSVLIGKPAPDFVLPLLHDPSVAVSAAQLRGAPYVLNVWGSWCVECREEHPVLTEFAQTKRVRVVGYNWKDEPEDALRWLERYGNPFFVVLADKEGRYALDWGVAGAPETFLVDGSGIVRWKHTGPLTRAVVRERLLPALEQAERAR